MTLKKIAIFCYFKFILRLIYTIEVGILEGKNNNSFGFDRIKDILEIGRLEIMDRFGIHLEFIKRISDEVDCGDKAMILKTAELYKKSNVSIFLGPSCSNELFYTAPFISEKNLLQITAVGLGIDRYQANIYENTVRLSGNIKASIYNRFIKLLLDKFHWNRVVFLSERNDKSYSEFRIKVDEIYSNMNSFLTYNITSISIDSFSYSDLSNLLSNLQSIGRIFFLFFTFRNEMRFIKLAYNLNMITHEYVYISFRAGEDHDTLKFFKKVSFK